MLRLALASAVLAIAGVLAAIVALAYFGRDLPSIETLRDYQPPETTRVVDRHGELIGELFTERRTVVPLDRVPREFVLCVLAGEDADFYEHGGLDYPGLVRSVVRAVVTGRRAKGTSTITQQVVKLLLLSPERTMSRKVKELILARRLEQELTKDEILHLYLNHINYGHGRYGVQEAAQFYFGKNIEDLNLAESSLIAGIPQSPARLSPRTHPENARRRQQFILNQLLAKRERWADVSEEEIETARSKKVHLVPHDHADNDAPEVMAEATRVLRETVGDEAFARGGYTVKTGLDLALQRAAREALKRNLSELDERHGYQGKRTVPRKKPKAIKGKPRTGRTYDAVVTGALDDDGVLVLKVGDLEAEAPIPDRYNPKKLKPSAFAPTGSVVRASIVRIDSEAGNRAEAQLELGPQGAIVVIDPRSRDVLALVGGYKASTGFNRATQAVRQPGSTFKPLVYALGIKSRRFTPASLVLDAPAVYEKWQPNNYETWNHSGALRLRDALAKSINLVAVRVIEEVSPEQTVAFARELGITSDLDASLALALGASDVSPIQMTNAYATFAAGGRFTEPRIVTGIEHHGQRIPLKGEHPGRDVLTPAEAYVVTSMLTSVVEYGTATKANVLQRPVAGKTGTSNAARDAWFVGYTPSVVAGVWVGFDDRRPLGRKESGGRSALPIWIDTVKAATKNTPPLNFPIPGGVTMARIDPASGMLAYEGMEEALEEVFLDGTVPTETALPPDVADSNTFLMEQFGDTADTTEGGAAAPGDTGAGGASM